MQGMAKSTNLKREHNEFSLPRQTLLQGEVIDIRNPKNKIFIAEWLFDLRLSNVALVYGTPYSIKNKSVLPTGHFNILLFKFRKMALLRAWMDPGSVAKEDFADT